MWNCQDASLMYWRSPWALFTLQYGFNILEDWIHSFLTLNLGLPTVIQQVEVFLYASLVFEAVWNARNKVVHENEQWELMELEKRVRNRFEEMWK